MINNAHRIMCNISYVGHIVRTYIPHELIWLSVKPFKIYNMLWSFKIELRELQIDVKLRNKFLNKIQV